MNIETILFVSAAINLIVLIVFFAMANNVSKIRKRLEFSLLRLVLDANEELYIGNKEKALECLKRAKYRIEVLRESYIPDENIGFSIAAINTKIEELSR